MNKIIIYSNNNCRFCMTAKKLLESKGLNYTEINIGTSEKLREEMMKKSRGKKTVPQIFVNDCHIGGYDDLKEAQRNGKLDEVLN
ncbi:MAG: glutaredoxin 3 [Rickettsiaceae bacterium H1]|nr:glutaredoxin 3 [Rickettsiaceae bacterium H1]